MKTSHTLQKIGFWLLTGLVFIFPFFFLPLTSDYYETNKQVLLVVTSLVLIIIMCLEFISEKTVKLIRSPLGLPILALLFSWLLSTFLRTPNKFDAFTEPGLTSSIVSLALLFISAVSFIRTKKELDTLFSSLLLSGGVLAGISILWGSNLFAQYLPLPFLKSALWTPTGSSLGTLTYLVTLTIMLTLMAIRNRSVFKSFSKVLVLILSLTAAAILGYRLFSPNSLSKPQFLSQSASWAIALEVMKSSPILGTGPSTYLTDFSRFRPSSFNLSDQWNIRFNSSSNYYLQVLATLGLIGVACYAFIFLKVLHMAVKSMHLTSDSEAAGVSFAASFTLLAYMISLLFVPPALVNLFLFFVLLILATSTFRVLGSSLVHEATIDIVAESLSSGKSPILPWVFSGLALAIAVPTLIYGSRIYLADYYFGKSLEAAADKKAKDTYTLLAKAITTNPRRDTYRLVYSQTSMLLANNLASKPELTPEEKNTVTQLIQNSIQEAKNAVALNPVKITNVENLAGIYRNLLGVAQGADAWTVASYRQAIALDPANPNLRIGLGGVYYALKNYDEAIRSFQQATDLKPDLPNAFYNLSAAYKEKGDFQSAFAAMQVVTNMVDKSSADYSKAVAELEELRQKLPQTATAPQLEPQKTQLEAPKPLPSPKTTPIKLPEELGPEVSGTPAPSPSPAPIVSPTP